MDPSQRPAGTLMVASRRNVGPAVLLMRGLPDRRSSSLRWLVVTGTFAGAGLVATTAAIHLNLWFTGYRHVPRLGVLFLLQSVVGFVLTVVLAVGRHLLTVAAGMVYMAASAAGLILSATVGFVGIHDGLDVPWAMTSLVVELAGLVVLGAVSAVVLARR